jgi:hypothetical protein
MIINNAYTAFPSFVADVGQTLLAELPVEQVILFPKQHKINLSGIVSIIR